MKLHSHWLIKETDIKIYIYIYIIRKKNCEMSKLKYAAVVQ